MIRPERIFRTLLLVLAAALAVPVGGATGRQAQGTPEDPIIDSNMTEQEAFAGLNPNCPASIRNRQRLIVVKYYSFDRKVHQGQLVMDEALVSDIQEVFAVALQEKFPIQTVIPISHMRFRKNGRWDDNLSMEANNTSGFNYRLKTGSKTQLSEHASGMSVDINPFLNPYVKGRTILPKGARYDTNREGTFTAQNPVVLAFRRLGWTWGGDWTSLKDYQHFEKAVTR